MEVNITIPEFLLERTGFVRIWDSPTLKHDTLGPLSTQDEYRIYRSRLRYLLRYDASHNWFQIKSAGEVGRIEGVRFIETK